MAVVTYQCSVCKRQNNIVQFQQGLDWIGHCNITLGCRGTLFQVEVHPDFVRGSLPPPVEGLKNWVQRKVLFNFTQTIARTTWKITHNLGTAPSVVVYVNQPTTDNPTRQVEILPQDIFYNSDDQLTLVFPVAYSGIAQCIARSSDPDILNPRPRPPNVTAAPTIQLSNQGIVTIATRISSVGNPTDLTLQLEYSQESSGNVVDVNYIASNSPSDLSPWFDTNTVIIKGKTYSVRTFNAQTPQTIGGQVANNSHVKVVGLNSGGSINIPIVSVNEAPTNQFIVDGDYSLYFTNNTNFQTAGTLNNNFPWVASGSVYNPETNQTTISVSNDITGSWPPGAFIVSSGSRQIVAGEVLILLGSSPFTIYDKIATSFVDFAAPSNQATQFDIFYNAGDLFASTDIQQQIYPPIRSVG